MKTKAALIAGTLLFLIVVPHFLSPYYQELLIEVLVFGLYCLGFDIIFGFAGLLNFGMSVFFGLGGYLVLWSTIHLGTGVIFSLLIVLVVTALFSCCYALLVTRFKSHYFVAFTIVISMIFFYMAMAARPITGADEGLTFKVPDLELGFARVDLYDPVSKYYFIFVICIVVFYLVWKFFRTPYGRAVIAVRENEDRARMLGYNTNRLKVTAFTISGVVSSLGGALYVLHLGFDSAHSFFWVWTARVVWWTIIGGVGTLYGAFVGPGALVFFEDMISSWNADLYLIIMGIMMIMVIILAPQGIVGSIQNAIAKRGKSWPRY